MAYSIDLSGKTAVITGSNSGIGLGIAWALARAGADVVLNSFTDRDEDHAIAKDIATETGVTARYIKADMSKAEECRQLITDAGRCDILVNNAGIQHVAPLAKFPASQWDRVLSVNLTSVFHLTKLVLPLMKDAKFGRIINIASVHGLVGSTGKSAYVAAKHGVIGLTKVTALEAAGDCENVTCNAVCPAWVLTPLVEKQVRARMAEKGITFDEAKDSLIGEKMPNKQFVAASEIGQAVVYLALPQSRGSTGTILKVDGGWVSQ
jgi:3-hydroxybutyrate dehydrogenase